MEKSTQTAQAMNAPTHLDVISDTWEIRGSDGKATTYVRVTVEISPLVTDAIRDRLVEVLYDVSCAISAN